MDLVRILETYSNDNDIVFRYGSKSHLNLLEGREELTEDKVHVLLFPLRRGVYNRSNSSRLVNGNLFLVLPDNYDRHYFNERGQDTADSKFVLKVEPLINTSKALENYLSYCNNVEIVSYESVEAIDVLDANLSGLFVTFQVRVYE